MRVLVTGGTGLLGRATVARLANAGHDVLAPPSAELDVRDDVRTAVARLQPEVVVHLAGTTRGDEGELRAVNVDGTARVAEAAAALGARTVLASSAAVYGDRRASPSREADDVAPANAYGASKVDAERTLGVGDVALRIFNVHGPAAHRSLVERLRAATAEAPVDLVGHDGFVRDYVHVADVAEAVARIVALPTAPPVLNVGTGVGISNRELVAALRVPDDAWRLRGDATSWSVADASALGRTLGWTPPQRLSPADGGGSAPA